MVQEPSTHKPRYEPRRQNEKIKRKTKQAEQWRLHYVRLKKQEAQTKTLEEQVLKLKNDSGELKRQLKTEKRQAQQAAVKYEAELERKSRGADAVLDEKRGMVHEISSLKCALSALELQNTELRDELDGVKPLLDQPDADVLPTKLDKRTYDDRMRQCVYYCLAKEVPVTNVSDVIGHVVETLAEKKMESLPSTASICRMKQEMGVLSDLQTFDAIRSGGNVTLAFDGTTKKDRHINEVHITTEEKKTLCVGLGEIPGGKAVDYHEHITKSIGDLQQSATEYHKQDPVSATVSDCVTSSITGIVTDRCVVNHAVVSLLEETYKHDIVEMKCQVHPLVSVATGANKALYNFDKSKEFKSEVYGNYSSSVNLIQALCKMRFKNGKGDPKGFKEFLCRKYLPAGEFHAAVYCVL